MCVVAAGVVAAGVVAAGVEEAGVVQVGDGGGEPLQRCSDAARVRFCVDRVIGPGWWTGFLYARNACRARMLDPSNALREEECSAAGGAPDFQMISH